MNVSRNENTIETKWLGELIETFRESADFDLHNRLFEYFQPKFNGYVHKIFHFLGFALFFIYLCTRIYTMTQ